MAAGDYKIYNCPQCKADNLYVGLDRIMSGPPWVEWFLVRCDKCGLWGKLGKTRDEGIKLWNEMS